MACKQEQFWIDEAPEPFYKGQPVMFGEMLNSPIDIVTTTPTAGTVTTWHTIDNLQLDHFGIVRRFKYDTIEEALANRHTKENRGPYLGR
jgi:hypothetical protein